LAQLSSASGPLYLPLLWAGGPSGTWSEVGAGSASGGGISSNSGQSEKPALALAPDGTPYAVWDDRTNGEPEIYVRRWESLGWREVGAGSASGGGISNNGTGAYFPTVSIAPSSAPYVAWADDYDGNDEIYVRRWDGTAWQEVGEGSASGGGISDTSGRSWYPGLAVAPDGSVYAVWHDDTSGNSEVFVRRWDGTDWREVGAGSASGSGISNNSGSSVAASIAVDTQGMPCAVWRDNTSGNYEIYVRCWDGSSWQEVGPASASGGGISNNEGTSVSCDLALGPDGSPYVVWRDDGPSGHEIFIRHWDGSSWAEVGAGSASDGGMSRTSGDSGGPSVAVAPNGTVYVAWHDDTSGNSEIYVRFWDGSAWMDLSAGSSSGGGISNNSGQSWSPSLAIDPSGYPYVAWFDSTSGNREVYVRHYVP
jgi:hypothetical protein